MTFNTPLLHMSIGIYMHQYLHSMDALDRLFYCLYLIEPQFCEQQLFTMIEHEYKSPTNRTTNLDNRECITIAG